MNGVEQYRARVPRAAKERAAIQTAAMQTATADSTSSGLAASAASVNSESAGGSASCGQTTCEPGPHVTSRSSDQQTLCATDMGSQSARGPDVSEPMSPCGTCGPFAVSTLLDIAEKDAETRCVNTHARLTTEHEERLRCSEYLGTPADGMCHHTVVHDVLRCSATSMSLVKPSDYATIHDGQAFAVYGKLNMAFRPFTLNKAGGLDRWTDEDCTRNTFFGLLPIDGEDNNDYHVIIINLSRLHCRHYSGRGPSVGLDIFVVWVTRDCF